MTNHPNRSAAAPIRYIRYSTASYNALSSHDTLDGAIAAADEFSVIFSTRSRDDLEWFDANVPRGAEIHWRGSNDLAQFYRRSRG